MSLKRLILFFLIISASVPASAGQPSVEAMYQDARRHYYALLGSPDKLKDRGQWLRVIRKFRLIATNRPNTKRGADAQYTTGLLYKKLYYHSGLKDDRKMAVHSFGRVVERYPKSTLVDDAERHIGDIRFRDSDYTSAARSYKAASAGSVKTKKRSPSQSGFAELTEVRRYSRSGYTRMILHLSKRTAFRADRLKNPDRIFIDVLGSRPASSVSKTKRYSSGLVRAVRMGRNSGQVTRVVLDLAASSNYKITALSNPFRIVIDLDLKKSRTVRNAPKPGRPAAKKRASAKAAYSPRKGSGGIKVIVLDPGHGGKDPGAVGRYGLKEKNVTLAIARKLKRKLERRTNCKVYMTRNSDRFVELDDRTVFANSVGADLFISIHVNSSRNRRANGLETYFLSPARSKDELETAARENMLAVGGSNPVESDLAYIMTDLENASKVNESIDLARNLQNSMVQKLRRPYRMKNKGVKQAMFYVLWRASMPSALVETGFISNAREERRLRTAAFQNNVAESLADGILKYSRSYRLAMAR